MKRRLSAAIFLLCSLALAGEPQEEALQKAIALARDQVYPCLVNIGVVSRVFRQGRAVRFPSAGSGVIVSPAGHVVTNFHVAEEASRITCVMPDGERIDADVVCLDPAADLAVLKLRLDSRADTTKPLPFAAIGDSDTLKVGDYVMAMGNPLSLSSSVTLGIVSNTSRVFTSFTGTDIEQLEIGSGQLTGLFNVWIQHDALIQPGNSGGPLVNMQGQVVGINTRGGSGMSFAIPSTLVKRVLAQALTYGEVRRAWMGITVAPVSNLDRKDGALLASVLPGSAADKAGLKPGDVILAVAGAPVRVTSFEEVPPLYARIADLPIGQPAKVRYVRGGGTLEADVTPTQMEKFVGEERVYMDWGVSAMDVTGPMAFARRYPDTQGVVITSTRPGYPAEVAKPALEDGDVVIEVGGEPVTNGAAFRAAAEKHAKEKALGVRFRRGKHDMVTVLDLSVKPPRSNPKELPKAWLGVRTQVLTPTVAEALGLAGKQGFRVTWVLRGTEAEKAGFKAGDVITHLDGDPLKASGLQDAEILRRRIEDMDIGAEAAFKVVRGKDELEIKVTLEETPETTADAKKSKDELQEYGVRELTYMDLVERDLPLDWKGLVVSEVTSGGWADMAGLRAGDLLLSIQDTEIRSIKDFDDAIKRIADERPKRVRIFVKRDQSTAFVFVQPDWPAK
ncbi:MAG: PDZ domain-containing protein [Planctomycetes bacterium]|nr:PDZ domain-containing protein [Planctomycetota bacterium]